VKKQMKCSSSVLPHHVTVLKRAVWSNIDALMMISLGHSGVMDLDAQKEILKAGVLSWGGPSAWVPALSPDTGKSKQPSISFAFDKIRDQQAADPSEGAGIKNAALPENGDEYASKSTVAAGDSGGHACLFDAMSLGAVPFEGDQSNVQRPPMADVGVSETAEAQGVSESMSAWLMRPEVQQVLRQKVSGSDVPAVDMKSPSSSVRGINVVGLPPWRQPKQGASAPDFLVPQEGLSSATLCHAGDGRGGLVHAEDGWGCPVQAAPGVRHEPYPTGNQGFVKK